MSTGSRSGVYGLRAIFETEAEKCDKYEEENGGRDKAVDEEKVKERGKESHGGIVRLQIGKGRAKRRGLNATGEGVRWHGEWKEN